MKRKHKSYDQTLKKSLLDGISVSLKALYMTSCPLLFDYLMTMEHQPKLNDKFLTTQLLKITSVSRNQHQLIIRFLDWMDKFSENAPKDVEIDYQLFCNEKNRNATNLILLSALDLISEEFIPKGKPGKLTTDQLQIFELIYRQAETRVNVATRLKIPITKVRTTLQAALIALN